MPTVYNIPRKQAKNIDFVPSNCVWISIQEPDSEHITNANLDRLPNLKIKFWDINERYYDIASGIWGEPITDEQIKEIYDFLIAHKEKNIIVNCRAGISRSGAIAQFVHETFGHTWDKESQGRAIPNSRVLWKLAELHAKNQENEK